MGRVCHFCLLGLTVITALYSEEVEFPGQEVNETSADTSIERPADTSMEPDADTSMEASNDTSDIQRSSPQSSAMDSLTMSSQEKSDKHKEPQTCSELYSELKKSDCGRTIFKYIKGASLKIGVDFNTSSLDIKSNDSLYARLVGILTPAPYYALSLKPQYFWNTLFGYQFALDYTTSSTVDQVIERGDSKEILDLHTLSIFQLAAFTPSVFIDITGSKHSISNFLRLGLGVGIGWSSVRGVAYFTEKYNQDFGSCYELSTERLDGSSTNSDITAACELQNFKYSSVGASVRIFLDGRWNWFYGAFEAVSVGLRTRTYQLSPNNVKIKLAYMLDI